MGLEIAPTSLGMLFATGQIFKFRILLTIILEGTKKLMCFYYCTIIKDKDIVFVRPQASLNFIA